MIQGNRKLSLADLSGRGNDMSLEINWNKLVGNCKYIRVKMGSKEAIISKEHLWTLVFMLSEEDKQVDMLPTVETPVRYYKTVVKILSKHDIKVGQEYSLPITISLNQLDGTVLIKP